MDWSRIPMFLRVVDQGSFTAAGKSFGVPKSTASRAVTALERELGTALLARSTRALELTEAGRVFYQRAKAARAALDEAQAELHQAGDDASGVVRLSLPSDGWPFAHVLAQFSRQHPGIHVELHVSNRHVNLIEEGIDLALRAGRLADSTLVARKLGQSDLGLFASAQYLKQHPAPKNVQGLESHAFVLFRARQGRQRVRLQSGAKERELTLRGAISSDDLGFVRALTAQGLGIGLLPVMMVASCGAKADGFERVLPAWTVPGPPVHVVMPASKYVPRRVRLLADFLYEKIRAEVWR